VSAERRPDLPPPRVKVLAEKILELTGLTTGPCELRVRSHSGSTVGVELRRKLSFAEAVPFEQLAERLPGARLYDLALNCDGRVESAYVVESIGVSGLRRFDPPGPAE